MASTKATTPTNSNTSRKKARKAKRVVKFSPEMRQRIVDEIKMADKAGVSRTSVFTSLAAEWTKAHRYKYTQHQVSSQFHLHKKELGYDKLSEPSKSPTRGRAAKRAAKVSKPKAKAKPKVQSPKVIVSNLDVPTSGLAEQVRALEAELAAAMNDSSAATERAKVAANALQRVENALQKAS